MAEPRKRLSLTKTDRQTSAGLELAALLQDISADGHVTVEEVERLKGWLNQYPDETLPARAFLASVIDAITQDGVITDDELDALSDAIQKVLPPELRVIATLRRKERRETERAKQVAEREVLKAQKIADRERSRPLETADFMVAGATLPHNRDACCDVDVGEQVWLQREPDNPHDRNAILVIKPHDDERLGYVPRQFAEDLAPVLDGNCRQDATIKKLLETARGHTIPIVLARLYRADSGLGRDNPQTVSFRPNVTETKQIALNPLPTAPTPTAPSGGLATSQWVWILIGLLVVAALWLLLP